MNLLDLKRYFLLSHLTYKSKYADSMIGIFWIPLSSLFLIAVLTLIFSSNDSIKLTEYAAYIGVGYITWGFIADTLNAHCDVFRNKRNDLNSPGTSIGDVFLQALVDRVYVYLLNLFTLSFVFIAGLVYEWDRLGLFVISLILLFLTSFLVSYLTSTITLYFPDFKRLISNLTRILFFSSPIFWGFGSSLSGARAHFYSYNPITYFLELMRYSLGGEINMDVMLAFNTVVLINLALGVLCFSLYKLQPSYLKNIQ